MYLFLLQSKFSSTDIIFIHRLFGSKCIFSQVISISLIFSDFVKFKDISGTCKMNLLFSRISRFSMMCGNLVLTYCDAFGQTVISLLF